MQRFQGTFCLLLVLIGSQVCAQSAAQSAIPVSSAFRLRPGDLVRLAVKDEPTLAGEYPVWTDGTVLLPLIGVVRVEGVEFSAVEREVRARFARELTDAVLVLSPSVRVSVLGEVRIPGLYMLDGTFDLSEALARAGGLTQFAAPGRVTLMRNGRVERLQAVDNTPVLSGSLQPGDQILVGRRSWLKENSPLLLGAGTSVLAAAITALLVRS
jgi:protein involved in polysaccharide export with SLBB domain